MDKYIPGDLVIVKTGPNSHLPKGGVCEFISYCNRNKVFVRVAEGIDTFFLEKEQITHIPLTPEILEKNGWKKKVMSRGVKNSHLVYTKPNIEEYGYFPIYIEKGTRDEFDVYPFTGNNVCTQIAYIEYVHQLQHLLFGLGLDSSMII